MGHNIDRCRIAIAIETYVAGNLADHHPEELLHEKGELNLIQLSDTVN